MSYQSNLSLGTMKVIQNVSMFIDQCSDNWKNKEKIQLKELLETLRLTVHADIKTIKDKWAQQQDIEIEKLNDQLLAMKSKSDKLEEVLEHKHKGMTILQENLKRKNQMINKLKTVLPRKKLNFDQKNKIAESRKLKMIPEEEEAESKIPAMSTMFTSEVNNNVDHFVQPSSDKSILSESQNHWNFKMTNAEVRLDEYKIGLGGTVFARGQGWGQQVYLIQSESHLHRRNEATASIDGKASTKIQDGEIEALKIQLRKISNELNMARKTIEKSQNLIDSQNETIEKLKAEKAKLNNHDNGRQSFRRKYY